MFTHHCYAIIYKSGSSFIGMVRKAIIFIAMFVCGLSARAGEARWITAFENQSATNTWLCFRQDICLDSLPQDAVTLKIAADSKYWLWINGQLVVFEGAVKRGPTPRDTYYDTVDVSPFLREGENRVAILLWYWGKEGFSYQPSGKAGLFVESLSGEFPLYSDKNWLSAVHGGYYTPAGEQPNFRLPESNIGYDARRFPESWRSAPVDSLSYPWLAAVEVGEEGCSPWHELYPRIIPLWKDYGLKAYDRQEWRRGLEKDTLVCHLPYNMQLTPYMELDAHSGDTIGIWTDNYKGGGAHNLRAEYIAKEGFQQYESLGWINGHAVYYVFPKGVELLSVSYRETSYDTSFEGSFRCNDDFYNRLWEKAQRTLLVTMRDTYMDCPDRERAQWWGDEVIESGESFYALCPQSHLLMKKGMYELMRWQRSDGTIFSPIPSSNYHTELPGQMLASIGYYGFWNYFLNTGDTATIADLYDSVRRYLDVWEYNADGTVKFRSGEWTWGDWGTNIDIRGLFNAWYYLALDGVARMADVLDKKTDAMELRQEMDRLKVSFNRAFWKGDAYRVDESLPDPDDRLQALAVVSGLADESKYGAISTLFRQYEYASPYMEKYVLEALFRMGHADFALDRMKRRFGKMVDNPYLTTLFEGWGIGAEGFGGGTYNHAWSGGGLTLLSQKVCGISPVKPGFKEFSVTPQMGPLVHAETSLLSVNGRISISLDRSEKELKIRLNVPANTQALLPIPADAYRVELDGKVVYKNGRTYPGKKYGIDTSNGYAVRLPEGEWRITMMRRNR